MPYANNMDTTQQIKQLTTQTEELKGSIRLLERDLSDVTPTQKYNKKNKNKKPKVTDEKLIKDSLTKDQISEIKAKLDKMLRLISKL